LEWEGKPDHLPAAQSGIACYQSRDPPSDSPDRRRRALTGRPKARGLRLHHLKSMTGMNAETAGRQASPLGDEIVGRINRLFPKPLAISRAFS
jgi:hypothetical protein